MATLIIQALVVGYLPGALMMRWPSKDRPDHAALPAEERVFWAVMLSLTTSCMIALGLGAVGLYTFARLLGSVGAISAALAGHQARPRVKRVDYLPSGSSASPRDPCAT